MEPLTLALVLSAAVFHALWNRTLHIAGDRVPVMAVGNLVAGAALLPVTAFRPPWEVWPLIIVSAMAEAAYSLCLATAYSRGALSVVYPLGRGTAPLLVTLGGWLLLAEGPGARGLAGAAALALGLALVALAGHRAGQRTAVGFALLTGVCIATYSLVDARAVREVSAPGYLGAVLFLTGLFLVGWMRGGTARLRTNLRPGLLVAFGSTAAYLLVLLAFQRAQAGRVSTLREISVLLGIALAAERPGRHVWVGAALVVTGMFLAAG
jgi:drug/metabolite transporter (DMT)-like permease